MAALSEEQSILRDQAKAWTTQQAPVGAFRNLRDQGGTFDPALWSAMVEMGWTGVLVPEQYGGSDLGYLTFGLILEELGKQLTASPLFASAYVGASALVLGGTEEQKATLLPKIVDGSEIFTLAVDEGPHHRPAAAALSAKKNGAGFVLSGTKTFVSEGMTATTLLVSTRTSGSAGDAGGITLFVVPANAGGLHRAPVSMMDSRDYAKIDFDGVSVGEENVLGTIDAGSELLDGVLDRARAGISAEMLGTSGQAFEMTLEYLKTRQQFGRVIGSFQALGHRAAELFGALELARSCAEGALQAIDSNADNIPELCSLSKAKVGDFLHDMSNQLIQIHGGIGMTDEFDAGFYLKRARVLETLFGNQAFHRDRYARLKGF